jgi:hypothetical protein
MNRENKKIKYFEAFRYRWISEKIKEYKMYSTESLEEELKALLTEVMEDKSETKLSYIALFFLNTSLYTKTYKYMLVAADESLYINKPLSIRFRVADFIKKDASLIREELIHNKAQIPDLSESEIEEGIRFVLKGYEGIIAVLWKKAVEKVFYSDILKNKNIKKIPHILVGEYMGELRKVEV